MKDQKAVHEGWSRLLGRGYRSATMALVRSVAFLFFVEKQNGKCYRCGGLLDQEDWHMDHIESWANAKNPVDKFWNIENLAASHAACNVKEANHRRRGEKRTRP